MIVFSVELVSLIKDEMWPLLERHYQELTLNKEVVKLEVDWTQYESLEKLGMLEAITAREDGLLVGYSVFFVHHHMHYKSLKVASNDVLFLSSEHRKGSIGIRLIKESEKHMRAIGVNKIAWHVKHSLDWSKILVRLGYANEELVLGKILG